MSIHKARIWLNYSQHYLRTAEILSEVNEIAYSNVMESCHQAVEWILKAYLTLHEINFPELHDIQKLSDLVKIKNEHLAETLRPLFYLSEFSGAQRYHNKNKNIQPKKNVPLEQQLVNLKKIFEIFLREFPEDLTNSFIFDFKPIPLELNRNNGDFFIRGKYIEINGLLPSLHDPYSGVCKIIFKHITLAGMSVMFYQEEILSELFDNLHLPIEARTFVIRENRSNHDEYIVKLGHTTFSLKKNDLQEFCGLVDTIADPFLERLSEIQKIYEIEDFKPDYRNRNKYQLITISESLWKKLQSFAAHFDFDKGRTSRHIFDARIAAINIFPNVQRARDDNTGFTIYMEKSDSPGFVTLFWHPHLVLGQTPLESTIVGCKSVYLWFVEKLIPDVILWSDIGKISKKDLKAFRESFNIQDHLDSRSSSAYGIFTKYGQPLSALIDELQVFFHSAQHINASKLMYRKLLRYLELCVQQSNNLDFEYLGTRLRSRVHTREDFLNVINIELNRSLSFVNNRRIELLFRAIGHCFDKNENLKWILDSESKELLSDAINVYKIELLRAKFSEKQSTRF